LLVRLRKPQSRKWDYGCVLVVGGSKLYSGAPALAALTALKTGVRLAVVAAPESVANVIRSFLPNLIVQPFKGENLNPVNAPKVVKVMERATSIVVGPGLGVEEEVFNGFEEVVEEGLRRKLPILINADGLKALAAKKLKLRSDLCVLTPHPGEFKLLTGVKPPEDRKQRIEAAVKVALNLNAGLVLKGYETVITDGSRVKVNKTGNPGMAVGGTGDVLSGIIATFLAQKANPFKASVAGAFINGLAGDLAAKELGYQLSAYSSSTPSPRLLES